MADVILPLECFHQRTPDTCLAACVRMVLHYFGDSNRLRRIHTHRPSKKLHCSNGRKNKTQNRQRHKTKTQRRYRDFDFKIGSITIILLPNLLLGIHAFLKCS